MVFTHSERARSGRETRRCTRSSSRSLGGTLGSNRHYHRTTSLSSLSSPLVAAASQRVKEARAEADKDQLFEVEAQTAKWVARRHKLARKKVPPEERERLVELFDALDTDGGGTINLSEFRQAFRMMMLDSDDDNHNGKSSKSSKSRSRSARDNGRRAMMRAVEKQFKAADVDGNGEVDPDEFVKLMTELEEASCGELGTTAENLGALLKAAANALRFRRYVTRAMYTTSDDNVDDDDGKNINNSNNNKENDHPRHCFIGGSASAVAEAGKRDQGYIGCSKPGGMGASSSSTTPLPLQPRTPQSQTAVSSGGGSITTPSSSSSLPAAAAAAASSSLFSSTFGRWRESAKTPSSSSSKSSPSLSSRSRSQPSSQSGRGLLGATTRSTPSPGGGGGSGGGGVSPNVVSSTMTEMEDELAQVEQALELASARRNDTWETRPPRGRTPTPTGSRGHRGGATSAENNNLTPQPRCQSATPTLPRLAFSPSPSSPSPVTPTTSAPPTSSGFRRSVRSSSARAGGRAGVGGSRARWH